MGFLWTRVPTLAVGFIGEGGGLSSNQREALQQILSAAPKTEFHFGDADGSAAEAAAMARACGLRIVVHPLHGARRAHVDAEWVLAGDAKERLVDIVDECGVLIVAPESREPRSATREALRHARKRGRRTIVLPY